MLLLLALSACATPPPVTRREEAPAQNPVLVALRLTPDSARLRSGDRLQLRATARWNNGATIVPTLAYVSRGGSVSETGLFTAGRQTGSFAVVAMHAGGTLADTAWVTIDPAAAPPPDPDSTPRSAIPPPAPPSPAAPVASPSPPSPSPPPGGWHEPAGFTAIVGRRFDSKGSGSNGRGEGRLPYRVGGSEGWDDVESRYRNVIQGSDPTSPLSPGGIMRFRYPAASFRFNFTYNPGVVQTMPFTYPQYYGKHLFRKLYLRTAFRVSDNFQGHPTSTNKMIFIRGSGGPRPEPILRLRGTGQGSLVLNVDLQGSIRDRRNNTGGLNPNTPGASGAGAFAVQRGRWHTVEAILEMGENGTGTGRLRIWYDGVLTHSYDDVEYEPNGSHTWYWEQIHIAPTWGGQGGTINQEMWLDVDDVYVSGAP